MKPQSTTTLSEHRRAYNIVSAYDRMAEQLRSTLASQQRHAKTRAIRLTVSVKDAEPLQWLQAQTVHPRMYWADRLGQSEIAAVGIAHRWNEGLPEPDNLLNPDFPELRYYGGMRFDRKAPSEEMWSDFGATSLVIPRFELVKCREKTDFVCNLIPGNDSGQVNDILNQLEKLKTVIQPTSTEFPGLLDREDIPNQTAWEEKVRQTLDELRQGSLKKIVLARKTELRFDNSVNPVSLLQSLNTPGCFRFLWEPRPGLAFVSVSPERLYRRNGHRIECEALAGTCPRSRVAADDNRLGMELLNSDKEKREHSFVTDAIRESLSTLCDKVRGGDNVTIMKLSRLQHLMTSFTSELRKGISDQKIIEHLHPTPAVAGFPVDQACHRIATLEPFDRGWYAGPIGWIGSGQAEFAVGIRSALVRGDKLCLYSGAGIVDGSDPKKEWEETENKMGQFLALFS